MSDQTIQEAVKNFLLSLNAEHTQQTYATPLKHFGTYLAGQGVRVERDPATTLTVDQAIGFVPWLRYVHFPDPEQPAKATLQLYLTAVYRFYRSLLKGGGTFAAADIARLEETYRDARNIRGEPRPKDPKLSAVEAIIEAARALPPLTGDKPADQKRELSRLRDIAIVEMLRSTGCRVGELVALRRGDLDWVAHSALVKGKGSKYRKVYLDEGAWMALRTYLHARQDGGEARALARLPVFCGHGNRSGRRPAPLSTRHVARIIQALAKKAGIGEAGVTPHYFRHVFATRALERTENLALVQDMLGHASPATTRVYAKTDEKQRRDGYARVWEERFEAAISTLHAVRFEPGGAAGGEGFSQLLQAAVVEVLWETGCHLEELTALRLQDVGGEAHSLRVVSRSEEETIHLLDEQTWEALAAYLQARGEFATEALFCEADGRPLSVERALAVLQTMAEQAGADGAFLDQQWPALSPA